MPSSVDLIPRVMVPGFDRLRPVLARAVERMEGLASVDDVLQLIVEDRAQFWPLGESCAVTELVVYPGGTLCRIWLGAGDLDELRQVETMIRRWARQQGCLGLEIIGRDGWAKALDGYRKVATIMAHRFDEENIDV